MRSLANPKAKGGGRANPHQVAFELKQRVVAALNKLADRDTYQIGSDELERIAVGLVGPESLAPLLSCVLETDSEQKSSVRKECVRVMGTLARSHGEIMAPHLPKMVGSIVKRLKDSDSVVRDACVETVGVLASKMSGGDEAGNGCFVILVKPLFEVLGEQNRQVQIGSALCLASIVDNATDPPIPVLLRMLTRVVKLMKNQHFMAKPALIELIRSIVQAGGASTEHALSSAMKSIQDALKSSDWTTRKAASMALAGIAACGGSSLGSFKSSCVRVLECCRFDKVKPVRDSVVQALQYWKNFPAIHSPEPSEAGSSTKENLVGGDFTDIASVSDGGWKDTSSRKATPVHSMTGNFSNSVKKRVPLAVKKTCPNYVKKPQRSQTAEWHIEISLPSAHPVSLIDDHEESEGSCVTKTLERTTDDSTRFQQNDYDFQMDDKPYCSSISDFVSGNCDTKRVNVLRDSFEHGNVMKKVVSEPLAEPNDLEDYICSSSTQKRGSLDSTVTHQNSQILSCCCLRSANQLALIQDQLLEIERKQSNLMNLLQLFMGGSMDSLSTLQSKVLNLESAVDRISQDLSHIGNFSNTGSSRLLKKNQSVSSSPRLSTCTPRPSVDAYSRQSSVTSMKNKDLWEETSSSRSRLSTSVKEGSELWGDPTLNIHKNPIAKGAQKSSGRGFQSTGSSQRRKDDLLPPSACNVNAKPNVSESKISFWKHVKDFLRIKDLESAYVEALCSGDDLLVIELMDKTGPVLERLSHETVSEILSTVAQHFANQRFLSSMIPWVQQALGLSNSQASNNLVLPTKTKQELLLAIQAAASRGNLWPLQQGISCRNEAEVTSTLGKMLLKTESKKMER
ncbi:Microtubule-associated protein TORTIFOLIA1 [Acorus calamus]|uniref:Microtubule-associated protein TORTIFOLIA1 n=1 Tax=Acorus calamus TaxID=4465 RepID=A0AAV9EUX4_ACOCL|nr:Microtubule-associated protein TORTIFOLIA1 [Acorus calamus]